MGSDNIENMRKTLYNHYISLGLDLHGFVISCFQLPIFDLASIDASYGTFILHFFLFPFSIYAT